MSAEAGWGGAMARGRNWLWLAVVLLAAVQLWRDPSDWAVRVFAMVASVSLLVLIVLAVQYVETRTQRPRKSYLRWAFAVAVLGLVLVAMPLALGAGISIGLMLWAGFAVVGLVWVYFYERTEPL
ncbi:MAG: hypothetical protein JNL35_16020 [Sphingopyxis sp.]|nr:hypothetical protein [Sphingopyxis sp.]